MQPVKQAIIFLGFSALLLLSVLYPFLPGEYDRLAMPLSATVQATGAIGLLLTTTGIIWLIFPKRQRLFLKIIRFVGSLSFAILGFFAFLMGGKIWGIGILALWLPIFWRIRNLLNKTSFDHHNKLRYLPFYFIFLPVFIILFQIGFAKSITDWSRDRTIANADAYIRDIENFKSRNGYYPKTLQAMYKDYYPQTVGVEKYHYLPFGDSYNLSFEQPRFLFDAIGTREWVVYNPKNEHRVYSHTSWFLLLSPEESARSQGWYTSGETGHAHWKYFLFD